MDNLNKIVELIHGSHLYGLSGPDSDIDKKGIFKLDISNLILQNGADSITLSTGDNNSKNSSEDEDIQFFSLQKFLQLCYKGEMTVIDMLHAPQDKILFKTPEWEFIQSNRSLFYTKNMSAYFSFVLSQCNKYSQRGGRLKAVEEVLEFLNTCPDEDVLENHWDKLPLNKYSKFVSDDRRHNMFECCGRKVHSTITVAYAKSIYQTYADGYGNRARKAKDNEIDNKAVSHAYRALYQVREMVETGDIRYPLKDKDFIMKIKYGQHDKPIQEILDDLAIQVDEVKDLLDNSDLPSKVNRKFWEEWLISLY